MGRESNNDPIAIQSSIALLQERFRQLQRVKEMREERELHRMLLQPQIFEPTMHYEKSGLFFHFLPPRSSSSSSSSTQVSLSGWPNSLSKHADLHCMETPHLISLQPTQTPSMHASTDSKYHDDVDTSLHL